MDFGPSVSNKREDNYKEEEESEREVEIEEEKGGGGGGGGVEGRIRGEGARRGENAETSGSAII